MAGLAFADVASSIESWWDIAGRDNLRVMDVDGEIPAGLVNIPMGLFVGGQRVTMDGVAGVAVAPEARGTGVASQMMRHYLRERRDAGTAVSALYASTRGLYRKVGYGVAGHRFSVSIAPEHFRAFRPGPWRPYTSADRAAIEQTHRRHACHRVMPDRGPYLWRRILDHPERPTNGFVVDGPDGPRAWLFVRQDRNAGGGFNRLFVVDWFATDGEALRQVAGMIGSFGAMCRTAELATDNDCPLIDLLPELRGEMKLTEPWMLRILSVQRALEQRGYLADGRVCLHIDDPILPDNQGAWTLTVENGAPRVEAGGTPTASLHVQDLASLYTGHRSPWALQARGGLQGEITLDLARLFAGPVPGFPDFF